MTKIINYQGWVEPVEFIRCDVEKLQDEYRSWGHSLMKPYDKSPQMMDLGFIIKDRISSDLLSKMPETERLADEMKKIFDYTSMVYRLMRPVSLYRWHHDNDLICYHVPVTTNPGCMFVYEEKHFHMPADGTVYLASNSRYHTFINAGDTDRIHIVFDKKNNGKQYALLNQLQLYKNIS